MSNNQVIVTEFPYAAYEYAEYEFRNRVFFTLCRASEDDIVELTQPYSCRDLLCASLLSSKFLEYQSARLHRRVSSTIDSEDSEYNNLVICSEKLEHLGNLNMLHAVEDRLGFKRSTSELVNGFFSTNYNESVELRSMDRILITYDKKWSTNTPTFSLFTGILRAITVSGFTEYDPAMLLIALRNGDVNDGGVNDGDAIIHGDYLEDRKLAVAILECFIDKWNIYFSDPKTKLLGFDYSDYTVEDLGDCLKLKKPGSVIYPLNHYDIGILEIIYRVYFREGSRNITFKDVVDDLIKSVDLPKHRCN